MTMDIFLAGYEDQQKWDDYVKGHPFAMPYHLFAWKKAVEDAYGHRGYYLLAEEGGEVRGVLPLVYMKPPFFSGKLVSLPFCDVGDVLAGDDNTKEKLVMEAVSLAQEIKADYIELRGQHSPSSFEYLNLPVSVQSHKVRLFLKLSQSSVALWDSFKSKLRSQIRKAEKNDLSFKWGTVKDLDEFYHAFSLNMRDLGSPVHSREWFRAVFEKYGADIRTGLVHYNDKLVGAGVILNTDEIVSIPWASTLREYNKYSPNMLLYWNLLKYAADNGYAGFDFGRSTPEEGTYKFKTQWGAKPVPLYWNYIAVNNRELDFNASYSARKEMIVRLWQKLPLSLANCIGPAIRKHISL